MQIDRVVLGEDKVKGLRFILQDVHISAYKGVELNSQVEYNFKLTCPQRVLLRDFFGGLITDFCPYIRSQIPSTATH